MKSQINILRQLQELVLTRDEHHQTGDGSHLAKLNESIDAMRAKLGPQAGALYDRLYKKHHVVISAMTNNCCAVCGMQVPIAQGQQVRLGEHLVTCSSCGRILFAERPDEPCLPASMVKMMDLLLVQEAIERGELRESDPVGVSVRAYKTGGSQVYLDPKESFPLEDMLYALMIQSANDAAVAIAEHVAGSCEAMVARMNARAAELGMTATRFRSVHGLPADAKAGERNDVSTPRDMAILALELCRHPGVFKYTGTDFRVFRPEPRLFEMRTHNPALQPGTRIAGADGLKTGYTRAAGYSLAVTAARDGRRVVVVSMGTGVAGKDGQLDAKASKDARNRTISALVENAFAAAAAE